MSYRDFSGKTVDEALTRATVELGVTSDMISYEVLENGSAGFFGLGSKDAVIRVSLKEEKNTDSEILESEQVKTEVDNDLSYEEEIEVSSEPSDDDVRKENVISTEENQDKPLAHTPRSFEDAAPVDKDEVILRAREFLSSVFSAMNLEVELKVDYEEEDRMLSIEMSGPEMGIIIGKRGQTLDSLQYLTNLAVNRKLDSYVRVKMDTEDYRRRRKATLENLAHHVSYKVKRTKRPVSLEPMNPYERRVIHYALQHDSYVKTESEGEEPYRYVVVSPR